MNVYKNDVMNRDEGAFRLSHMYNDHSPRLQL